MIDRPTVDAIYAAANIVEVVGDFVSLKKKGTNYQACCPFHNEKTPSFVVSPAKGVFKCFGCGKGGNAVTFVMEHEQMDYVSALRYLASKYGIHIEERQVTDEEKKRVDDRESMMVVSSYAATQFVDNLFNTQEGVNVGLGYFKERGLSEQVIRKFQLGYCFEKSDAFTEKALAEGYKEEFLVSTGLTIKRETGGYYDRFCGRVMFPVHSISGRVIAFGGRTLRQDKKVAKYLNSPESEIYHKSNILYGLFFAKKSIVQLDRAILVEGYTDVISMCQAGIENVVASSGTSLTQEQIKLIGRFTKNVTVIYDGDSAGINASLRGIDMILAQGLNVRVVLLPDGEDPDSFARKHNATYLSEFIREHEEDFISFKTRLLMQETRNDPIKKAEVITDIVTSISVIPDDIARAVYIKECARMLDMDEEILVREVRRKVIGSVGGRDVREALRNAEKIESVQEGRQEQSGSLGAKKIYGDPALERELLTYLLKYGDREIEIRLSPTDFTKINVAQTIIEELDNEESEFYTPLHNKIFKVYVEIYMRLREEEVASENDSRSEFPVHELINHEDKEVVEFVVGVMADGEEHVLSSFWERTDACVPTESDRLPEALPKALFLYRSSLIARMRNELTEKLQGMGFTEECGEILRKMDALAIPRSEICKKYMRLL